MEENKTTTEAPKEEEAFSLKNFLVACGTKWQLFVISIIFCTLVGYVYVIRQQPEYLRTMSILIKNQNGGGGVSEIASSFSSLGLVSTNTNVYNELISLTSPAVMSEVVEDLDLTMMYAEYKFPHPVTLYGKNQPFVVSLPDVSDETPASFRMDLNPDGSGRLYRFAKTEFGKKVKYKEEVNFKKGETVINTPIGRVQLLPNSRYPGPGYSERVTISVRHLDIGSTIELYSKKLKGELADRDADVIDLSIKDESIERADDILNTVLKVYTSDWMADKNRMAVATSQFIDDRLKLIEAELGTVDTDIMKFKSENYSPDLEEAARINLHSTREMDKEILTVSNELGMARYVNDYINNPANQQKVIPVNTGVPGQLEAQITNYNTMLLTRNNLAQTTSATNPLVVDYDAQLKGEREAIGRAIQTQVVTLQNSLNRLEGAKGEIKGELASAPTQAKKLLSVERQQMVKEQLYLYLLQKREENELTQTFTADNTRVITPPYGKGRPVSPKKTMTVGIAFLLGLLIPVGYVYVIESSNTRVRSRKDLEHMSTPFAGEIPFVGRKSRFAWLSRLFQGKKKKKELENVIVRVQSGSRDLLNESFRIVRGNIDFMSRGDKNRVYMITSFNPGSGKSFISYNLATSFAIKGKKVLLIDCDLRHGSASQYVGMPSKGITAYLTGNERDWHRLVVADKDQPDLYILPIGHRPPNPAELLETPLMKQLINEAKEEYDYVLLDCPPVDIVVDTQILSPLVDRTIFVVRAGLLEKSAVEEIDELYKTYRFKQMSIILNGTEKQHSRYGTDGRGYYGSQYSVE